MSGIGRKMVHGKFDVSEGLQRAGHVDVPPSWICAAKIVSRCVPHCESCCGSSVGLKSVSRVGLEAWARELTK